MAGDLSFGVIMPADDVISACQSLRSQADGIHNEHSRAESNLAINNAVMGRHQALEAF